MIWLSKNKFFRKYLPMFLSVVVVLTSLSIYLVFKEDTKTAEAQWYNSSWQYRKSMSIDHTKVGTTSASGNTAVGISQQTSIANRMYLIPMVAGKTGIVTDLRLKTDATASFNNPRFKGIITNSSYNILPNGITNTVTVNGADVSVWYTAAFANPPSVTEGATYYIGFVAEDANMYFDITTTTAPYKANSFSSPTDPTSPSSGTDYLSVYANIRFTGSLSNFPVLFNRTDVDLKTTTYGGGVGTATGQDILFTLGDGVTKLDHEIEKYASTTGETIAWIRIPSFSSMVDTTLYIYYGNTSATDQQNKTGVWDSNYKAVWHLPNGTSLTALDSTSNSRNGSLVNTPTAVAGQIDGAANGANASHQYISFSDTGLPSGSTSRTMSGWAKETSFAGTSVLMFYGTNGSAHQMSEMRYTSGGINLEGWSDDMSYSGTINTGTWYYIVGVFDGTNGRIYLNGNLVAGPTALAWNTVLNGTGYIGHTPFDPNGDMNGARDEFRVSSVARSNDWIITEYNNQSSPLTFFRSYGNQESVPSNQAPWYNASWGYRKQIVINKAMVSGTSTLSNFPVLINIPSDPNLKYTSSGGYMGRSDGLDAVITKVDGTTTLSYEMEKYSSTTGETILWVNIPTLNPNADTVLYLYYGNSGASDMSNKTAVWDSSYKGVWHLPDGSNLTALDSTSNANNGTISGASATAGRIDGATNLNGSDYILGANTVNTTVGTVSAWVYLPSLPATDVVVTGFVMGNGSNTYDKVIFLNSSGQANFYVYDGSGKSTSLSPALSTGTWTYLTGTANGTTAYIYKDGEQGGSVAAGNTYASYVSANNIIGGTTNIHGTYLQAYIDEVRVSNVVRSAEWIKTEYNNQSNPPAYISVLGQQTYRAAFPKVSNWYSASWTNRRQITIDKNKINTATGTTTPLVNFPMLFSATDAEFKTVANGGKVASSTGADILFTTGDGTTKLNHELEYYASTTGQIIAWVQIPSLSNTADTVIYMYYGNSGASDQQNKNGVWDSNYKGVWHLPDGTTLTANDSTSNANNGTLVSSPTADTGKIDGGGVFGAGGTERYISTPITNTAYTRGSIEWWQYNTYAYSDPSHIDGFWGHLASGNGLSGQRYTDGNFYVGWQTNRLIFAANSANYPRNTWVHYSYVWTSGGNNYFYANGAQIASGSSGTPYNSGNNFHIAKVNGWANFTGRMDEFRLSDTNRSADWIATEYNNQSSPETFYALGASSVQNPNSGTKIANRGAGLSWYNNSWSNRKTITIDHNRISQTATTTFSNFPFLFSTTDTDLKYTGSGGRVGKSDGTDILFTDSNGTTKLDHEIEYYASTTGQLIAWVRIPTLTATADYPIHIYFGNSGASDQQNKTGVWDSNFKAVYHLPNGTVLSGADSTSNANNGTLNSVTVTSGQIDGAASFAGTDASKISKTTNASLNTAGSFTLEAWINGNNFSSYHDIITKTVSTGSSGNYYLETNGSGELDCGFWNGTSYFGHVSSGANLQASNWYHVACVFDEPNNTVKIYRNGVQVLNTTGETNIPQSDSSDLLYLGGGYSSEGFPGKIDEARVSLATRTFDWISTEYNNQSNPSTFYSYSALGAQTRTNSAGGAVPEAKSRGGVKFR